MYLAVLLLKSSSVSRFIRFIILLESFLLTYKFSFWHILMVEVERLFYLLHD